MLFPERKPNVLLSFGKGNADAYTIMNDKRSSLGGLILDSGAWQVQHCKQPKRINLDGYADYLKQFSGKFDFYLNFDDDWGENHFENNLANLNHLESFGFNPVPVIHDIKGKELDYHLTKVTRGWLSVLLNG